MQKPPEQEGPAGDDLPHLAQRLDSLFRTVTRSDDPTQLHSSASAAAALQEQGITVTSNHIRALRTGRRSNPSFRLLAALAELFHVPLAYFSDDEVAREIDESLDALSAIRDTGVEQIMLRAHGVSSESLSSVLTMLDQIRRIEGLDEPEQQEPGDD